MDNNLNEITVKEMLEYLAKLESGQIHEPFCTCSKCEKEFEEYANSAIMKLDFKRDIKK